MSLKRNVIANYLGQGWRALMGFVFIPLYIQYLGIEAYGLIGVFAVLQAWLSLLEMGMKPALAREMARFTAGAHDSQAIRDLLRSVEIIGLAIALCIFAGTWAASNWLASQWITAQQLPVDVVARAIVCMGAVTGLRFIENLYVGSIVGLQRQVLENIVGGTMATARALGAVAVLRWISPTIDAFFIWQGIVSLLTIGLLGAVVHGSLPAPPRPARFSASLMLGSWRFTTGMMAITFLALLLTQIDKILLSRLLTLKEFSYYALAGVVAGVLHMLTGPITSAFYPRFTEVATRDDQATLAAIYHQAAQLVSVLVGSAAIVLVMFNHSILLVWTGDAGLTQQVAPLLAVLALGTLLNGLMWIPYQMQLAHGWTSLTVKVNVVAVLILIPAIFFVVPAFGALGAAWAWVALNAGYLVFAIYFMHRRVLRKEKWRWYGQDVILPLIAAASAAALLRWMLPDGLSRALELFMLVLISFCVLMAAAVVAPSVRQQIARILNNALSRAIRDPERCK